MPVVTDTPTRWTIVDPLQRYEPKETESAGVIARTDDAGYFTTHRKEVADELKTRYPWMLVTEHEEPTGGRGLRVSSMVDTHLPGNGWMSEAERKAARERERK